MIGRMKVQDVKRPDVAGMMKKMTHKPADANRTFSVMRRMFNLAEVWGYRPDGTNPCRHVPMFPNGKATHLISDEDMGKLFRHLDHLEAEGLEHYVIPLAIRLQFEFAGRRGERSEEHTSELQSLMRISYAVFCLKKKKTLIYN